MTHDLDTVFAECYKLAQKLASPDPLIAVHIQYVRREVTEHFTWMLDENNIHLATGALAAFLSERGWVILFDALEQIPA